MKTPKSPKILSTSAAALLALFTTSMTPLQAVVTTWVGGGVDNLWGTAGNFTTVPAAFDDLVFAGVTQTANVNDLAFIAASMTFAPGAGAFNLAGAFLPLDAGGITNNSGVLQTINFASVPGFFGGLSLFDFTGSTQTWNAGTGGLLIVSDVTFNAPVTLIVTGSGNTTISGVISDVGIPPNNSSLVKNGSGVLRLTALNTFPGNTTVNAGTLLVDGAIASRNTFVNAGGTLGGIGTIGGHLFNSGNVAPGDSPGTLTVKGNYTQSSGGTLTIEIAGKKSGQFDVLAVGGTANLDGTLRLVKLGKSPRLKVGEKITFLTANGGVNGEFSHVENPFETGTIVQPEVVYHENSVALEGVQGSFSEFASRHGLTFNQRAVAGGLDHVAFRGQQTKLIDYLNCQPLSDLPSDFDKIAPDEIASVFNTGVALATVQSVNIQRRMSDIRAGSNGFSASGFHAAGTGPVYSGGVAGPTGVEGKESKFVVPPENRFGAFLTGVGEWVDVDGDGNARGYDINSGGFTLGLDYKFTPNFAAGISAGYVGTRADLNNGGKIDVNGGKVGLFATYFTGGFYVDGAIAGGYNSYDTNRRALQGTARGDTDGAELNLLVGTGYDWKIGALTIGPTATFQYTYLDITDFTENGSLAPLRFQTQSVESIRTTLGFKASYDWKVGGVIIRPELRAAWQHEYGDDAYDVNSSFNNGNGNLFTVRGPEIGRDSMLLGAGFAVLWNERTSTYVYYDGELFRDNYDIQSVSGGVRITF